MLTKHKGYKWGPPIYDYTEAQVDKVIWKVVPEENTRVTALQAGQADASQYVPYWSIKELQANVPKVQKLYEIWESDLI